MGLERGVRAPSATGARAPQGLRLSLPFLVRSRTRASRLISGSRVPGTRDRSTEVFFEEPVYEPDLLRLPTKCWWKCESALKIRKFKG